tara:strand:- start:2377 stop:3102 length:726 start_codon:yes stop_codon:yes gene_type:complete
VAYLKGSDKSKYVASMFGRISSRYDFLNTLMTAGRHHAWRKIAVDMLLDGFYEGIALDVATGTGDFAIELARSDSVGVVGLDFSSGMISVGQNKILAKGIGHRVSNLVGDAHMLPFADETFACATVGFGVRNFIDLPTAIREIARVLQPGGRIAILEIVRIEKGIFRYLFKPYFKYVTPWIGAVFAGEKEAYTYLPQSVELFLSAREMLELMLEIGMEDVSIKKFALGSVAIVSGRKSRDP